MGANLLKPDGVDTKHAGEEYNLGFELEGLGDGETVETVTTEVIPATAGGLEMSGSPTIDGNKVSDLVSGGMPGNEYKVRFRIKTNAAPLIIKDMVVRVIP